MYKQHDYRCLKPNPKVPSSEWGHYDMHGFRAAKSTKELGQQIQLFWFLLACIISLEKVKEIPFDIFFYNFADPKVLYAMTDGTKRGLNLWKKTYGFDHAYWIPGKDRLAKLYKCQAHCIEAEFGKHGKFSNDCKKNKGFYKCCAYQ